jgi:PhnB protein
MSQATKSQIDPLNRNNYTAVTVMLAVGDVERAYGFYQKAFGFQGRGLMPGPDGKPLHAELRLRESTLMLGPENPAWQSASAKTIGNTPATLYVLVEDVDKVTAQATAAGATLLQPPADMFWGDRTATLSDPDGNKWMLATHKSEPTPAEMDAAMKKQMS